MGSKVQNPPGASCWLFSFEFEPCLSVCGGGGYLAVSLVGGEDKAFGDDCLPPSSLFSVLQPPLPPVLQKPTKFNIKAWKDLRMPP